MQHLKSTRDVPGTQRQYETIYILRADATTEQIHEINVRVRKVIESSGGKLVRVDNWGKRKLAYEIKKQLKGIYLYWLYLGESELVAEIERNLRMLDLVVRYYTVKVTEGVDPNARPTQMDEDSFAATATTIPDEEDTYLGRGTYDDTFGPAGLSDEDERELDSDVDEGPYQEDAHATPDVAHAGDDQTETTKETDEHEENEP